jgi:hypothetical protein
MSDNPWPDFDVTRLPRTLRRVLLEKGSGIEEKTRGTIKFFVLTKMAEGGGFIHECYLSVPQLEYRYPFFQVIQACDPYPATIVADPFPQDRTVKNESELVEALHELFWSEATKNTVTQLLEAVA